MPAIFDDNNRSLQKRLARVCENRFQPAENEQSTRVPESKEYDADRCIAGQRENFTEIQIEGQDNALLNSGLAEDFPVGETVQSFVAKVNCIMILAAKPVDDTPGNPHIGKKSHGK